MGREGERERDRERQREREREIEGDRGREIERGRERAIEFSSIFYPGKVEDQCHRPLSTAATQYPLSLGKLFPNKSDNSTST